MEENGVYKRRTLPSRSAAWYGSAKGKMLASSIAILLFAAAVFFGVILILCLFVLKCGIFANSLY